MMECNAIRQAVCVNETVFDSVVEVPLEADIILPDYCPDIVKILKCSLDFCISSSRVQGRQLSLEGMCSVHCLYLGEDSAGTQLRLRCIDYKLPYTKTVDLKGEAREVLCFVSLESSYCNCRAVSKRRIELRASASHRLCAVSSSQQQAVTEAAEDTENPLGVQLRQKSFEQNSFVSQPRETISVSEQMELGAGKAPVRSIISSNISAVMTDHKLISGKIVTKGELHISLLYSADTAADTVEQMEYVLPISGVVDAPGADDSCICSAGYEVCEYELSPKSDLEGENTLLELHAQVVVNAEICRRSQISLADDCYSTRYECEGHSRPMDFLSLIEAVEERNMYKGEIQLPEEIETILSGWGKVSGSTVRFEEKDGQQQAVVQLNLNLCLLATDRDGSIQFYDKTEPMECAFPIPAAQSGSKLIFCPQASVVGFDYNRSSDSLQVRCEVLLRGCICQMHRCSVMEEISVDQEHPVRREDDCSLTIYYADAGENLWEIAKRYHTAMQSVMEANQQVELSDDAQVTKREMLLIPILSR